LLPHWFWLTFIPHTTTGWLLQRLLPHTTVQLPHTYPHRHTQDAFPVALRFPACAYRHRHLHTHTVLLFCCRTFPLVYYFRLHPPHFFFLWFGGTLHLLLPHPLTPRSLQFVWFYYCRLSALGSCSSPLPRTLPLRTAVYGSGPFGSGSALRGSGFPFTTHFATLPHRAGYTTFAVYAPAHPACRLFAPRYCTRFTVHCTLHPHHAPPRFYPCTTHHALPQVCISPHHHTVWFTHRTAHLVGSATGSSAWFACVMT